jgi:hypothetical protein
MTNLLFQKRDGDLAVEVSKDKDGHHRIELLRTYQENGEWKTTNRLGYADHHRGKKLLEAAHKWIQEQDQKEGRKREAERQAKQLKDWTRGLTFGQRIREKRKAAGMEP